MRQRDTEERNIPDELKSKLIGEGSTRLVFDIGEGKVMKVADTLDGCVQNYNESFLYRLLGQSTSMLCSVYWTNSKTVEGMRFLIMMNGYIEQSEWDNEMFRSEEELANFLGEFGVCPRELELGRNWIGFNLVDYGGTVDSNPIHPEIVIQMFKDALAG